MAAPPFVIKICGVKTCSDLDAVASAGGDAVGLNFYPQSIRYLPSDQRMALSERIRKLGLTAIGVFVNTPVSEILNTAQLLHLQAVQLHGDESIAVASEILDAGIAVIRAVRLPRGPLEGGQIDAAANMWINAGCSVLFDADAGPAYGGEGLCLDWQGLGHWRQASAPGLSFALAGGLSPEWVGEAIRKSEAAAVDVASGVESPRGTKSWQLIEKFVGEARRGLGLASRP